MDEICERDRSWFCQGWAARNKGSKETVPGVEFTVMWREIVERKPNTCNTTKQSGWSGTDDKGKGKPGTGKGKGKHDKGKGKGKNKNKGKGKLHGKKGKNVNHGMDGHELGSRWQLD